MNGRTSIRALGSSNGPESRDLVQGLVLMAATAGGIYVCYRLTVPFLPALAWALALAVLFAPLQRWIETVLKRPDAAAALSVLLVALIVVVPATLVAERLIVEAARGAVLIKTDLESGSWRSAVDAHPRISIVARWLEQQLDVSYLVGIGSAWLTDASASVVRGSITQAMGLLFTFYLLFYFLRDRRAAVKALLNLSPLSAAEMGMLSARVVDTIHATLYGTVVCATVQGILGGLMFRWLDLPAPLLWGLVMGLLAVVPVFGAFVVWIPTAFALALEGSWGQALILTVWGTVVVGFIDNLLYPVLVGNRLKLHTVPAFVSLVGGLIVFGPSGVILGPLAVTITQALLEIWRSRMLVAAPEPIARRDAVG